MPMVYLLMLVGTAHAQDVAGDREVVPSAPQSHVLDEAVLFRESPESLVEIEGSLRRMRDDYGYPVYLAIYYSVYDGSLQERADLLHRSWIGEGGHGMVIVYQQDPAVSGGNPALSFYKGSEFDRESNDENKNRIISGRDITAMLHRVFESTADKKQDHTALLGAITFGLERELKQYYAVEPASWSDTANLKLMAIFLGVIAVLGLLGMLVWKLFTRADAKSSKAHYFPDVKVSERLGAPFGGGWISEKAFVASSSQK